MSDLQIIAGRYQVQSPLGEGGFARVYKAIDLEMGRKVAVKVLKLELLERADLRESFLKRFSREISVMACMEHPHVVPIYDSGTLSEEDQEQHPFMVMKLLKGQDLEEMLRVSGPLPPGGVLTFGKQALDALAYVHAQGVVHKDLKPANFFLSRNSRGAPHLYVMDFGIAHSMRGDAKRMTQTGAFTGTLQYLAPEYMMQQLAEPSVDVYQMGLILLETLSNRPIVPPHTSMNELVARFIRKDPVPIPDALRATPVGEVLHRATLFDHTKRYQNAGEFLEAWEALSVDDFPVEYGGSHSSDALPIPMFDDESSVNIPRPVLKEEERTQPAPPPVLHAKSKTSTSSVGILAGVAMALVALIGACIAVVVTLMSEPPDQQEAPQEVVEGAKKRAESMPPDTKTSPEPPQSASAQLLGAEPKPDKAADALKKASTRALVVMPKGAHVYKDGEYLGEAPLELPASSGFELRIKKAHYEEFVQQIEPGTDPLDIALAALPTKARTSSKRKKKKPATKNVEESNKAPVKTPQLKTTLPPEF